MRCSLFLFEEGGRGDGCGSIKSLLAICGDAIAEPKPQRLRQWSRRCRPHLREYRKAQCTFCVKQAVFYALSQFKKPRI